MAADNADAVNACEQFIWGQNPGALREQPLVNPETWAGAVQHDVVRFGLEAPLRTPAQPGKAYFAAAVVMMVKDEADIIGENLTWLYFTGLRRFVLLDNGSTDETAVIIERFRRAHQDSEVLVLKDPLIRYMQAEKTTGLYRLAISIWPDVRWIIPADADEFLIAEQGYEVLDDNSSRVDAVSIPKVIHFRREDSLQHGASVMGRMDYRSPLFCVPPKIVARNNLFITITQGNHKVRLVDDRPPIYTGGFKLGLYYREFPTRSFQHFLCKIRNGGPAIKAAEAFLGRKVGGEHWVNYYEALQSGGEGNLLKIYLSEWVRTSAPGFVVDPFVVDASALK